MQVFHPAIGSQWIVGVVGQLQLDVLISRLQAEYKVDAGFEPSPWDTARWITADDDKALDEFKALHRNAMAEDRDGAPVFMAKDAWELNYVEGKSPGIRFSATKDRRCIGLRKAAWTTKAILPHPRSLAIARLMRV